MHENYSKLEIFDNTCVSCCQCYNCLENPKISRQCRNNVNFFQSNVMDRYHELHNVETI